MNEYRYIERNNWGIIQKYQKSRWWVKFLYDEDFEWVDFGRSTGKKEMKDMFNRLYKDLKI